MSDRWDRDSASDRDSATVFGAFDQTWAAESHEPLHGDEIVSGVASTIAMNGHVDNVDYDITAVQKMISAISGSLLTSLLGKSYCEVGYHLRILTTDFFLCSHSPRCRPGSFTIPAYTAITSEKHIEARGVVVPTVQYTAAKPWSHCMLSRGLFRRQ
jgi:hypothetical protein